MRELLKKWSTKKLNTAANISLGISIFLIGVMCFILGMSLYRISHDLDQGFLIYIVPTILCPLALFPALLASSIKKEIKERRKRP